MPTPRTNRRELLQTTLLAAGSLALSQPLLAADESPAGVAGKLKITKVKTFLLTHTLKRAFGVSVSVPLDKTRTTLLIKIETDEGIFGWGETYPVAGVQATIEAMSKTLVGRNPLEYRKLWRELWGANFGNALALGGVEMALNDVRGKALGMPVAELFGGRLRDRVPAYASAMNYQEGLQPEDHYPQEAAALVKQGYKALKMRLGRYPVAREAAVAAAVRKAVGPDIKLMVDGNAAYTLTSALHMGKELDALGFEFFEEPLPQSPHYAGYEELRTKLTLPLAGGEATDSRGTAKELLDRKAFQIIQPDVSLCGGIGEVLWIAELAAQYGVRCIPHCWGGAILIAATLHLNALIADPHWGLPTDSPLLELDQSENPWRSEIVKTPFQVDADGFVQVPTVPGLGVEVNEEAVMSFISKS